MSDIIEKIKKLLRMKRGGTPAEIETALALAAELARKHNLDLDEIDPDDIQDRQPLTHIDATTSSRISWECKYAGLVCQQFFNVTVLLQRGDEIKMRGWRYSTDFKLSFIGTSRDIEIALYIYHYLVGHFRWSWNHRKNKRLRNRQDFLYGMYHGLCYKLDQQRGQQVSGEGLIKLDQQVELRSKYMEANFGKTKGHSTVPDSDATASRLAGVIAGHSTEIRTGLTDTGSNTLLLT